MYDVVIKAMLGVTYDGGVVKNGCDGEKTARGGGAFCVVR